jgi:major membrane immunogen (membrane-anchored lipoprotein)
MILKMKIFKGPIAIVVLVIFYVSSSCFAKKEFKGPEKVVKDTLNNYRDGFYEGKSRSLYTSEPFWGIAQITVKNGLLSEINFMIRDSTLHETFNGNYEKHFEGNDLYIQQCRNDWNGVNTYPKKLSETQNPDKIDAMSGATWSYNIFKASTKQALKNARNLPDTRKAPDGIR